MPLLESWKGKNLITAKVQGFKQQIKARFVNAMPLFNN